MEEKKGLVSPYSCDVSFEFRFFLFSSSFFVINNGKMLSAYSFPFKAKRSLRFYACGVVNRTFMVVPFGFFHLIINNALLAT